ncbi:SLATT domain-containing protein [Vitreoscilla massiliensis]|uniref:SLATT domain-containing protein n=1 Tax=Vitreoscilla massiliensis TaxID=1689272 RepID=A0ABY4E128_9NEIS|nr:SLATT domain-containing protein [Vitreoscilla massiliensis]UOO89189.1 SLATT domain-containing protein [Vitreoscilla massiliensis]
MERNSQTEYGFQIESQIREAYGKLVYTYTCHNKMHHRLLKKNNNLKIWQIVLSAISTVGFFGIVLSNHKDIVAILSGIVSVILLILNAYTKNFDLVESAQAHQKAADALWKVREEYVSLLTDFEVLSQEEIMNIRTELQNKTGDIYSQSPKTDGESYKEAQKALKTEEEQTFSEKEIDILLPEPLRRCSRKLSN